MSVYVLLLLYNLYIILREEIYYKYLSVFTGLSIGRGERFMGWCLE